jgi:hypothetical protein
MERRSVGPRASRAFRAFENLRFPVKVLFMSEDEDVVDDKGGKTALRALKQQQNLIEDLHDLTVVKERKNEQPISLEEMKRMLEYTDP